jgi:hypothetical protein
MPAASAVRIKRRGRGNGDNDRRADGCRLLHHLDRHARGDDDRAGRPVDTGSRQGSGEFVQRVVAADIFAGGDNLAFSLGPFERKTTPTLTLPARGRGI